jgi:RNA polymerase sigma-70 factor (ECF subfamily)
MATDSDDRDLAESIVNGEDPVAEEKLCRRWFGRIRAYGRLHLRDAEAATDLAQEVLIIVIRALRAQKVADRDRLGAYISGVCRNTVRDWQKTARRRSALLAEVAPAWSEAISRPPVVEGGRLSACLGELGARDRAVVVLTFYGDCDAEDIARELRMSIGNVRVTRHRALKQLLVCLGGGSKRQRWRNTCWPVMSAH